MELEKIKAEVERIDSKFGEPTHHVPRISNLNTAIALSQRDAKWLLSTVHDLVGDIETLKPMLEAANDETCNDTLEPDPEAPFTFKQVREYCEKGFCCVCSLQKLYKKHWGGAELKGEEDAEAGAKRC